MIRSGQTYAREGTVPSAETNNNGGHSSFIYVYVYNINIYIYIQYRDRQYIHIGTVTHSLHCKLVIAVSCVVLLKGIVQTDR